VVQQVYIHLFYWVILNVVDQALDGLQELLMVLNRLIIYLVLDDD
jgi:hypothetical protein